MCSQPYNIRNSHSTIQFSHSIYHAAKVNVNYRYGIVAILPQYFSDIARYSQRFHNVFSSSNIPHHSNQITYRCNIVTSVTIK